MKTLSFIIFTICAAPVAAFLAPLPAKTYQVSSVAAAQQEISEEGRKVVFSTAIPFMERPVVLDGTMAGDVGFDPLNFAKSPEYLNNFREAELKHGRLAMLAAAGWPLSEILDKKVANLLQLPPLLDANDRAPSLLNGGLGKVSPVYWALCLAVAAIIDFNGTNRATFQAEGYFPGNLGFDPLGLYPKNEDEQKSMQTAEIKHGRVAMIAVVGYAVQEFVYKTGVVDETPFFFSPLWSQ